jgi:hypothetical protein
MKATSEKAQASDLRKEYGLRVNIDSIFIAAASGSASILKDLLERGIDINIKGIDNVTPLMTACYFGHDHLIELFKFHGANLYAQDLNGKNVMDYAVRGLERFWNKDISEYLSLELDKESRFYIDLKIEKNFAPGFVAMLMHERSQQGTGTNITTFNIE